MLLRTRRTPAGFIPPCLPSPAERPPSGPGWLHEIKHDGFRMMVRRDAAGVRLLTRNGIGWSTRYPLIRRLEQRGLGGEEPHGTIKSEHANAAPTR
jgi:ATP-dependent DNA ligase